MEGVTPDRTFPSPAFKNALKKTADEQLRVATTSRFCFLLVLLVSVLCLFFKNIREHLYFLLIDTL